MAYFRNAEPDVIPHILHQYSKESARKSEMVRITYTSYICILVYVSDLRSHWSNLFFFRWHQPLRFRPHGKPMPKFWTISHLTLYFSIFHDCIVYDMIMKKYIPPKKSVMPYLLVIVIENVYIYLQSVSQSDGVHENWYVLHNFCFII